MNTLEIDSVSLSFNGKKILSDVYLECLTGEIVALIGRNGAGKSCLMKLMFGTLRGDHQSVRLNGKYIEQPFTQANTIHYLHQDGFAMNYLRFDDLANAFAINNHLDKILELGEIKRNRGKRISELSGGEKKLMEIVALLYAPGKFLLLDEPFSYLSPVLVEKLAPHIEAQSKFKGIVITDHQYRTVLSVCNKYYLLTQGVLTRVNTILELERFGYLNVH